MTSRATSEWCWPMAEDREDPRVLRGGSWGDNQDVARCAERDGSYPDDRYGFGGFRVVCSPPITNR
jgi:formylglycine-generating enzyme required for sulfatase activity